MLNKIRRPVMLGLSIALLLLVGLGSPGIVSVLDYEENSFSDLSNDHPYAEAILYLTEEGILNGYGDGTFRPDGEINRAEFTKIIIGTLVSDEVEGTDCFLDVQADWYAKYVCTAKENQIVSGYSDGTFRPEQFIVFSEAAKIVVTAFDYSTVASSVWYEPFTDALDERDAIPESIEAMDQYLTRGEFAELIYRLLLLEEEGGMSNDLWNDRIEAALAETDCLELSEPEYESSYYTGPMIDSHLHIPHIPDGDITDEEDIDRSEDAMPLLGENITISEMACTLEQEGTERAVAFFPVFPEIDWQSLEIVKGTMESYPDLFIPFIMPPDHDNDPDGSPTVTATVLEEMLEVYPDLFDGYGEIGLYPRSGGGAAELLPDDDRLLEIYPILSEQKLLVYFHPGDEQADNLARVLEEYPDVNFMVHGDQIQPTISELMDDYPNVYFTMNDLYGDEWLLRSSVTKEEFIEYFDDYESLIEKDLAMYEELIEEHPDRFMWGTDRGGEALWTLDPEVGQLLADYGRAFIGRLDADVQENFAYKNVLRALGEAEDL